MSTQNLSLIFHEQWLGISTLTILNGQELIDEIKKDAVYKKLTN